MRTILLALMLFFVSLASVSAQSEAQDSSWYYSNLVQDYLSADYVAWVKVGKTNILSTNGMYTNQQVNYSAIRVFKGNNADENYFYAWLENQNVVWKEGTIHGFFLKQSQPDETTPKANWFWMENTGFRATDTAFITSLADQQNLRKQLATFWDDEMPSAWVKAKIIALPKLEKSGIDEFGYFGLKTTLELQEDNDLLESRKGSYVTFVIYPGVYSSPPQALEKLKKGHVYDVFIFKTEEGWKTNSEFIFK